MSGLERLIALFVASAAEQPSSETVGHGGFSPPVSERRAVGSVALLAPAPVADGLGAAVGLVLADPCACVCTWGAAAPPEEAAAPTGGAGAGLPAARRVAASLGARDLVARASGRLIRVTLDPDPHVAVTQHARAVAACGSTPALLVVGGPRPCALEHVVADHDRVLVAGDPTVAALAARALGPRAVPLAAAVPAAARGVALAGLALPPGLRREIATVLEGAA